MRRIPRAAIAATLALAAAACAGRCSGPFGMGHPCVDETDCLEGLHCNVGFCLPPGDGGPFGDGAVEPGCGNGLVDVGEACDDGNKDDNDACAADCTQEFGIETFFQFVTNQADILFVIDSSGSMCEEQINLRSSFQSFVDGLTAFAEVDYHIGVVTTDTLDADHLGRLQNTPVPIVNDDDCLIPLPPPQDCTTGLPDPLPKILTPMTPDLARTFGCISQVGITGFGGEAAFAAVELALSPGLLNDPSANAGFLRPGSLLAVIFVGDEDDCSVCHDPDWPGQCQFLPTIMENLDCAIWENDLLTEVDVFVDAMQARRPDERIFVAAIIALDENGSSQGPIFPDPDTLNHDDELFPLCESVSGRAAPAPRIENYARAFEPLARVASICEENFSPALLDIGEAISLELLVTKCFSEPPCPEIEREEISVTVSIGGDVYVLEPLSYSLRFEEACAGGYQLVFTTPPPEGASVVIRYPMLSKNGLGCGAFGN